VFNPIQLLTLTYVQYDVQHSYAQEPVTQTGVWLGTSSGGQMAYPKVKA